MSVKKRLTTKKPPQCHATPVPLCHRRPPSRATHEVPSHSPDTPQHQISLVASLPTLRPPAAARPALPQPTPHRGPPPPTTCATGKEGGRDERGRDGQACGQVQRVCVFGRAGGARGAVSLRAPHSPAQPVARSFGVSGSQGALELGARGRGGAARAAQAAVSTASCVRDRGAEPRGGEPRTAVLF